MRQPEYSVIGGPADLAATELSVCETCGSLVADEAAHTEWHDAVDKAAQTAYWSGIVETIARRRNALAVVPGGTVAS